MNTQYRKPRYYRSMKVSFTEEAWKALHKLAEETNQYPRTVASELISEVASERLRDVRAESNTIDDDYFLGQMDGHGAREDAS